MSATVCFLHGRESGPWGTKIRRLARVAEQLGCRVISPDDRDTQNPEERVRRLVSLGAALRRPLILVGSSMGGYVAVAASSALQPVGLFLLAPAVGLPGYGVAAPLALASHIVVVHGWDDAIVPTEQVVAFAQTHRATLHLLADGHLLQHDLDGIARLFADFLGVCLGFSRPAKPRRELVATL
jgi:pimeloyl-ACP methyl ester carboxylesterase